MVTDMFDLFKQKLKAFFHKVKNRDFAFPFTRRDMIVSLAVITGIFLGDQLTKQLAGRMLMEGQSYELVDNIFYFTYVHNTGMAWSLFQGARWIFVVLTIIAIMGMIYFFTMTKKHEVLTRCGLILTLGGSLGNLADRVFLGYVRDFIHFYIFGYDFPIFNVADIAVVMGIGLIILEIFIQEYKIWKLSKTL